LCPVVVFFFFFLLLFCCLIVTAFHREIHHAVQNLEEPKKCLADAVDARQVNGYTFLT